MRITNVTFRGSPRAEFYTFVSVTFDKTFVVNAMAIIRGKRTGRMMLVMPGRENADGTRWSVAHPITADFRKYMEDWILKAYQEHRTKDGRGAHDKVADHKKG